MLVCTKRKRMPFGLVSAFCWIFALVVSCWWLTIFIWQGAYEKLQKGTGPHEVCKTGDFYNIISCQNIVLIRNKQFIIFPPVFVGLYESGWLRRRWRTRILNSSPHMLLSSYDLLMFLCPYNQAFERFMTSSIAQITLINNLLASFKSVFFIVYNAEA